MLQQILMYIQLNHQLCNTHTTHTQTHTKHVIETTIIFTFCKQ